MDAALSRRIAHRLEVLARVRHLLIHRLRIQREPDEIDPDTPLFGGGLALDSIDTVDLLVHLKGDLGVDVPDDHTGRSALRTVNSLVDLVLAHEEEDHASD